MNKPKFRYLVLLLSLVSLSAAAFNLDIETWPTGEATYYVDYGATNAADFAGNELVTTTELTNAFIEAANNWTTNSSFNFNVIQDDPGDICAENPTRNGTKFAADNCGMGFNGALAVETTSISGTSTPTHSHIIFDTDFTWDVYTGDWQFDPSEFRRVALHELGHALGLDHPDAPGESAENIARCAGISNSQNNPAMCSTAGHSEALFSDDLNGADAKYDLDQDGIGYADDNCPVDTNADQLDTDEDLQGDVCDADKDGDDVFDTTTVDQEFGLTTLNGFLWSFGDNDEGPLAQTFTVGITGTLVKIGLPISCGSGNLQIKIQSLSGANPSNTDLVSATVLASPPNTNSGFIEYTLDNSFEMTAGTTAAIVVESTGICTWDVATGSYSGGDGRFSNNGTNWFSLGEDLPFQTFVAPSVIDNCPLVQNADQTDTDEDGTGDACETIEDADDDGVEDGTDNCPAIANADQANNDGDSEGDACDTDDDNDGMSDSFELTYSLDPFDNSDANEDADGDGKTNLEEFLAGGNPRVNEANVLLIILGSEE